MGVPSLYKWLTNRFPEVKIRLEKQQESLVDNLYLDFNAIIHPCCDKTLSSMADTESQLYMNLEKYVDELITRIRPRRLLYISVDGVAPRAKLNQQRSRRFVHSKEVSENGNFYFKDQDDDLITDQLIINDNGNGNINNEESRGKGVFDTNAISPGTEFMYRLDLFIQEMINYKISSDPKWSEFNVIYSNYLIPGEGEQKIMDYIRKHQNQNFSSIIYSPDADLIFLGMILYDNQIMILREEAPKFGEPTVKSPSQKNFILIDIPKLRNLIIKQFKYTIKIPFNQRKFLEDWIFLCFTVGNDFLPCTPCFEIRADALDKLSNILQVVYTKTKSYITDNGKINYSVLREFFIECARRENGYIVEKRNNLISSRARMNLPYDSSNEYYLEYEKDKIRYYIEKMGINSEEQLLVACQEYIKGLEWVYRYYFHDIPSWEWFYPFHFAPFMADLALVKDIKFEFDIGKPLKPFEQLLAVLPANSKDLLPICLHPIFTDLISFYPTDFKLDMFQKCMDWQAVAILPFIDVKKIITAVETKQHELEFSECQRNIKGYPMFFSKQSKIIAKAYPLYIELRPHDYIKIEEYNGQIFPLNKFVPINDEILFNGTKYVNRTVKFVFDQEKTKN